MLNGRFLMAYLLPLMLFGFLPPNHASAQCAQADTMPVDTVYFDTFGACPTAFEPWYRYVYDIRAGEWSGRGVGAPCDTTMEFAKHEMASALIEYDVTDVYSHSWHSYVDYRSIVRRFDSGFHNTLRHNAENNTGTFGRYQANSFGNNKVFTACAAYDFVNVAHRAGTLVHEGWHGWQDRYGYSLSHIANDATHGDCMISGASCDYYYPHRVRDFEFGWLYGATQTGHLFHSPNQVEMEFLCDLGEHPSEYVSAALYMSAASRANTVAVQRFVNRPVLRCGDPRPW